MQTGVDVLVNGKTESAGTLTTYEADGQRVAVNTLDEEKLHQRLETFRPNDKITREQAMAVLARAMVLTDLKGKRPARPDEEALRPFTDAAKVSDWALPGIADTVRAGIVTGRNGTALAPQAFITRAEVAAMVERLLQQSDLI